MNFLGWLLTAVAQAFAWVWGVFVDLGALAFAGLNVALNPILSPVFGLVNRVCTWLGDGVYAILAPLPTWLGLFLLSAIAGVLLLVAFGRLSNQDAIGRAKDDIKANLLALKLYKDELRVTIMSQWRLLCAIGRLQRYMLVPVLILAIPMLPAMAQMGVRYQWRPLRVGETGVVVMTLAKAFAKGARVEVEASPGFVVEAAVPGGGEIAWRIRATRPGHHMMSFRVENDTVTKELAVGDSLLRVSAVRPPGQWASQLLHPVERPLADSGAVESIEIQYPSRTSWIHGADYWVLTFFVVSMVFAIVLRPVFHVRF